MVYKQKLKNKNIYVLFDIQEPSLPYFTEAIDPNQQLFVGKTRNQLTCGAGGEPEPSYSWFYEEQPANKAFPELKTFTHTTSFLEFPDLPDIKTAQIYTGTFECRLNNSHGNITQKINLKVNGTPSARKMKLNL